MDYTSVARTAATLVINPSTNAKVYFDTEYTDEPGDHGTGGKTVLAGDTNGRDYTGTLSLRLAAAAPAGVSVRMIREKTGEADYKEPETDLTPGLTLHSVSVTGRVDAGRGLVAEILNASGANITVEWAALRLLSEAV